MNTIHLVTQSVHSSQCLQVLESMVMTILVPQYRNNCTSAGLGLIKIIIIRLFRIQYKTRVAEACDYFLNSTLEEI